MILKTQHRRHGHRIRCLLWALLGGLLVGVTQLSAHPFLQDSWWTVIEERRLLCRVTATLREITIAQGLPAGPETPALGTLIDWIPQYGPVLAQSISVIADGRVLPAAILDSRLETEGSDDPGPDSPFFLDQTHAVFDLEFPLAAPVRELEFRQRTLQGFSYALGTPWDVTYSLLIRDTQGRELGAGIVRADLPYQLTLGAVAAQNARPGTQETPEPPTTLASNQGMPQFLDYLRLGIHHILHGYDHLLFLAALVLAMPPLRGLLGIILAFTLAHSITITLAALQWVRVPSLVVEPIIAGSIVVVALMNLLEREPDRAPYRIWIAFAFGLVHGLGFAGGLGEALGSDLGHRVAMAILGFCVGVEIGHISVGLPAWGLLRAGRLRWGDYVASKARYIGSAAVALGGLFYLIVALQQVL